MLIEPVFDILRPQVRSMHSVGNAFRIIGPGSS